MLKIQVNYDTDAAFAFDLLRQAAWARNLEVIDHSRRLFSIRDEAGRTVNFSRATPGATPVFVQQCMADKRVSKQMLRAAGVQVAEGQSFVWAQKRAAWAYAQSLGGSFVVKPVSGEGGKGVTTRITTEEMFDLAWEKVRPLSKFGILIERFVTGGDHRVVVIGDTVAAVLRKWPLYIRGDGVHTVAELLEIKRQSRLLNAFTKKKKFEISATVRRTMLELGLTDATVIEADRYVELDTVGNLAAGGESEDIPVNTVHPGFLDYAVKARKCMPGIEICGLDLLAEDITKSPEGQSWGICELNVNPDFGLNHFPVKGEPRDVSGMVIEHYFPQATAFLFQPRVSAVTVALRLPPLPAAVDRLVDACLLRVISGGIYTDAKGKPAMLLMGAPNAVNNLIEAVKTEQLVPGLGIGLVREADPASLPSVDRAFIRE